MLGDTEFLVLMGQYNFEIFSCYLRPPAILPFHTSSDQCCDQLIQAMRNYDPRVRIVFVYKFNSNFHSKFTLYVAGCDFPIRAQFWCSLESDLSGQMIFHLLVKYAHDVSLALQTLRTRQCALLWCIVRQPLSGIPAPRTKLNHTILL